MKNIYNYLKTLLIPFVFILQNCSKVSAQICSKTNPINCLQFEPLARLWNVSNEEVPELLDLEKILISLDSKLQPLLNELYFGGTYLDIKAGKVNVNTVDQSKVDEIRNKMKNYQEYLNFIAANNTLSQLNSTFNQTFILAQQFNLTNCIISIEPKFNNVVIYLSMDDGKNKEFIENVETFNPRPIIKLLPNEEKEEILFNSSTLVEKRILYTLVEGGSRIVHNNGIACSAGFWMKKNNEDFIVSAGHCYINFPALFYVYSIQNNHLIGPMGEHHIRLYDIGFIRKTNTDIILRPVIRQFYRIITQFLQFLIVGSSEITSCGVHICKAGQRTGISCGLVSAFNSVQTIGGLIRIRTIVVPMDNNAGDSGGSMFRYNGLNGQPNLANAVGIYIGGFFGDVAAGMPISIAFDFNYSLVTHNI
ncbi:S1 family peptidase [Gigaspora margarita]|uniref:S1 family peptidase n=1 Tax=Gigaspora margarita TaxID=4874 RepID=A0A8H3WZ33_GIGMA|nr:S1 family peptidase [Gigaspora margarita]